MEVVANPVCGNEKAACSCIRKPHRSGLHICNCMGAWTEHDIVRLPVALNIIDTADADALATVWEV